MRAMLMAGVGAAVLIAATAAQADVKAGVDAWQAGDYGRAIQEWQPLANAGDADAQFNLGQAYKLGQGVPKNMTVAQDWFTKAATQGHEQAQATLGLILFQNGDRVGAMPWIKKAAEAGEPRAQYIYGTALYNGDVVSRDLPLAYAMMTRASAAGLPQAANSLQVMDQRMPGADKTKGAELAKAMPALNSRAVLAQDATGTSNAPVRGGSRVTPSTFSLPGTQTASAAQATPAPAPAPAAKPAAAAKPAPEPKPVKEAAAKPAAEPKPVKEAAAPKPAAEPKPVKEAAAKPEAPKASASGPWRIQLGAYGTPGGAKDAWKDFSGMAAIGGRGPTYQPAGAVTRLQVAGFSQAAAADACAALKRAGKQCLAVKP